MASPITLLKKICTQCGIEKELHDFHIHHRKTGSRHPWCRDCRADRARRRREANPEEARSRARAYKAANRDRVRELARASTKRRRVHLTAYQRAYRQRNREKVLAQSRKWREANKGKQAEYARRWAKKYPEKVLDLAARRRARLRSAPVIEPIDRNEVFARDSGRCHLCGRKVARARFHLDHLVPLSKGGSHTYENVAVAHPSCNVRRYDGKTPAQLLLIGRDA